jgi:hypothetical protein
MNASSGNFIFISRHAYIITTTSAMQALASKRSPSCLSAASAAA